MKINIKNFHSTTTLDTLFAGDTFAFPDSPNFLYIVIEPDYGLDSGAGVYCVDLVSGGLYCFDEAKEIIPAALEATASFD